MTLDDLRVSRWTRTFSLCVLLLFGCFTPCLAQTGAADAPAPAKSKESAEFLATADEVLQENEPNTGLRLRAPVKKTLRSRDDVRAYLIRQIDDDKNPQERYADARAAEAFGLIPSI